MDTILSWDVTLFKIINGYTSSALLEAVLPWLRNSLFWIPLYTFFVGLVVFNLGKKSYWFLMFIILTMTTSDMTSSRLIKNSFKRLRPCNTESLAVIERVHCGAGYSFTSSHATNHFALSSFLVFTLGIFLKRARPWLWLWAASVGVAQVFVGVHYPIDVLCGGLLGTLIGWFWSSIFWRYYGHTFNAFSG